MTQTIIVVSLSMQTLFSCKVFELPGVSIYKKLWFQIYMFGGICTVNHWFYCQRPRTAAMSIVKTSAANDQIVYAVINFYWWERYSTERTDRILNYRVKLWENKYIYKLTHWLFCQSRCNAMQILNVISTRPILCWADLYWYLSDGILCALCFCLIPESTPVGRLI